MHANIASAVSSLPTPLLALLAFLLAGALSILARAIHGRVRTAATVEPAAAAAAAAGDLAAPVEWERHPRRRARRPALNHGGSVLLRAATTLAVAGGLCVIVFYAKGGPNRSTPDR